MSGAVTDTRAEIAVELDGSLCFIMLERPLNHLMDSRDKKQTLETDNHTSHTPSRCGLKLHFYYYTCQFNKLIITDIIYFAIL